MKTIRSSVKINNQKFETMKMLLKPTALIVVTLLIAACTKVEVMDEIQSQDLGAQKFSDTEAEAQLSDDAMLRTTGSTCSPYVNFGDLQVETSWVHNDPGNLFVAPLACGVDNEGWLDKRLDSIMVLKTLPSPGHRTELKEAPGLEAALDVYKRMVFRVEYYNIPQDGEITVAQIHNRGGVSRPWIRLYLETDGYFKIKETETCPTCPASTYTTYVGPQYSKGELAKISLRTRVDGVKKAYIAIKTPSHPTAWIKKLTPSCDWQPFEDDYYFKAGIYTQGSHTKDIKAKYINFKIEY